MRPLPLAVTALLLSCAALCLPTDGLAAGVGTPQFLGKWGGLGPAAGQLNNPSGIAVNDAPFVFVLDSANNRVDRFAGTGAFEAAFGKDVGAPIAVSPDQCLSGCRPGTAGDAEGQLESNSEGIAATSDDVWVTDESNNRLERWNGNGFAPDVFGGPGAGAGQMTHPSGVAIDATGQNVYVVDQENRRIDQFTGAGSFVRAWGFGVDDGSNA